jgi:hypothetical protein
MWERVRPKGGNRIAAISNTLIPAAITLRGPGGNERNVSSTCERIGLTRSRVVTSDSHTIGIKALSVHRALAESWKLVSGIISGSLANR